MHLLPCNGTAKLSEHWVAVKLVPIVYCLESPDLPQNSKIAEAYISGATPLKSEFTPKLLGGVTTIEAEILLRNIEGEEMFRKVHKA